jgi:hypothetical protein
MGPQGRLVGAPTAQLQAFAQSVNKMIKNRYYDDLTSADGQTFLSQVVDWLNEYIDELEYTLDSDGNPIDWIWVRQPGTNLGTAVAGTNTIAWNSNQYNNLVTDGERFVQIIDSNGNPLANFSVVNPSEISNVSSRNRDDLCALVNGQITFSRNFTSAEDGKTVLGDVTTYLPRVTTTGGGSTPISATNVNIFNTVKPLTLLKLGVVKNAILPDIVRGKLMPPYSQKHDELLQNAIQRSQSSSLAPTSYYSDYSDIRGVGI